MPSSHGASEHQLEESPVGTPPGHNEVLRWKLRMWKFFIMAWLDEGCHSSHDTPKRRASLVTSSCCPQVGRSQSCLLERRTEGVFHLEHSICSLVTPAKLEFRELVGQSHGLPLCLGRAREDKCSQNRQTGENSSSSHAHVATRWRSGVRSRGGPKFALVFHGCFPCFLSLACAWLVGCCCCCPPRLVSSES